MHHIWANARGQRKDAGGMQWIYLDPSKRKGKMTESYRENKRGAKNGRARSLRCVETGRIYETCRELAHEIGVCYSVVSVRMKNDGIIHGLHYEYINKGEYENGIIFSESKERTGQDQD